MSAYSCTRDPILAPLPSRLVPSDGDQREGVGPVQTVNTPASRTRGQIRPSQRGQTKLSQPLTNNPRGGEVRYIAVMPMIGPYAAWPTSAM